MLDWVIDCSDIFCSGIHCRLARQRHQLAKTNVLGKIGGAVGNYNAHMVSYPTVDWPSLAEDFVTSLGLSFNPYVT